MEWDLLSPLDDGERREVLQLARRRRFKRGEVLFHEGDPGVTLHLVDRGHVAMRVTTPLGDIATLAVKGPGDYFGELALVGQAGIRNATVVAVDTVETLSVQRDQFDMLRGKHRNFDEVLVEVLANEVRRMSDLLVEAHFAPVEVRVFRRLAELARLFANGNGEVVIPLTQDDVASLAGTTRPSANKVLRAAQDEGILQISRGSVEILDRPLLDRKAR